jgi:two-component system sensor histidine kinase/response regulator
LNKKTETKALTISSLTIIALSIAVSLAGFVAFFSLGKVGSNLPIDSITEFRNIADLQSLVSLLSADIEAIQANQQDISWDELRFTINKIDVSREIIIDGYDGQPPDGLRMILDETRLMNANLKKALEAGAPRTKTEIQLIHNQINYIFSELRDYIVRSNNSNLIVLEQQRRGIDALRAAILALSLLALCGAVMSAMLLRSRRKAFAQVTQAREAALMANKAKGEFLSNMSHEIRTPMNTIMGLSYLALKTDLTPSQRDYLRRIQLSSQHLLSIINDVLDFSKIEAGKLSLEAIPFELDKVLDTVSNLVSEKANAKGLELIFEVDKSIPNSLIGDPLRLGQILINLANNAVKFTEKGEISIQVKLKNESKPGVFLYFEVKDTGIGVTDEQKARLFRSFEQADTSVTREYGGSGLGLAISKNLVEMMGGEIGLESAYGQGSTFWFTALFGRNTETKTAPKFSADLRDKRVLVVDDNDHARAVLAEMLANMGFLMRSAASGAEAVEEARTAVQANMPFDIVLLDWKMPGMSGVDTARKIRSLGLSPEPKFVIITAYSREEVVQEALSVGIKTVLVKPMNASILFDAVMQMLCGNAPEEREKPPSDEEQAEAAARDELKGMRILLVDDNRENQLVATELLGNVGCQVTVASNGLEALTLVKRLPFDIVLMDMQMPVMDGITATHEIRLLPNVGSLPIVAMTANAMKEERDRCMEAGMDDYLTKPIEPKLLFEALWRFKHRADPLFKPQPAAVARAAAETGAGAAAAAAPALLKLETGPSLDRLMGNKVLYIKLLRLFIEDQEHAAEKLRAAGLAGDIRAAGLVAHSLKGTSATIGAMDLRSAAEELETLIRQSETALDQAALEERVARLEPLLKATIAAIESEIPELEKPAL